MKHSKILILVIAIFTTTSSFALELWQKYRKLEGLSANFEQVKEIKSLGVKLKSRGQLQFKKPDFFEWEIKEPKPFGFVFHKDSIQLKQNGAVIKNADLSKMDPKMMNAISHMKAWLTMDDAFIEANYTIKEISKTEFEFTPKGDAKIFQSIKVTTADQVPVKKMELFELSGDVIQITFENTKLTYEK